MEFSYKVDPFTPYVKTAPLIRFYQRPLLSQCETKAMVGDEDEEAGLTIRTGTGVKSSGR